MSYNIKGLLNDRKEQTMKRAFLIISAVILMGMIIGTNTMAAAADLGLVARLSKDLGVTKKQATGGAGSIFKVAKQNMTADDFTKVAKAVPGINKMMAASPKADQTAGILGSASSLIGEGKSSVAGAASLAGSFSQLGMDGGMVNAFIPIILDYVKEKGGETVMNALQSALTL
jgi:hypothetical protein